MYQINIISNHLYFKKKEKNFSTDSIKKCNLTLFVFFRIKNTQKLNIN
jgi:hypothetical protein